jgi:quinol monooxygenase YgiN
MSEDRRAPARCPVLVLLWALGALAAIDARAADPVKALTFIDIRDAATGTATDLRKYAAALRRHAPAARILVLQEASRPSRFVLLEDTGNAEDLGKAEAAATPIQETLRDALIAPPDRRTHKEFGAGSALTTVPAAATGGGAQEPSSGVYVIAHVDIGPPDRAGGEAALRRLAEQAHRSPGNLRFDVWQQTDRANHFNVVSAWSNRAAFDAFETGTAAREFRGTVARLIGSLFDDRIYRPL